MAYTLSSRSVLLIPNRNLYPLWLSPYLNEEIEEELLRSRRVCVGDCQARMALFSGLR